MSNTEQTIIEHNGYRAQIMESDRLTGEQTFGLPSGSPLPVYPVDMFLKAPENWIKGPGSFVIPVKPNKGLWFNFRMNSEINTAVIMTVKGVNPITGMQTSGFHLEKYETKCPKHGCDFLSERFCPECNYKWPDRGYLSQSPLWQHGFRTEDGIVRQFYFTEDELRDVASALIGKENTTKNALGFAFYSPKERRSEPVDGIKMEPLTIYNYHNYPPYYWPNGYWAGCCWYDGQGYYYPYYSYWSYQNDIKLYNSSSVGKGSSAMSSSSSENAVLGTICADNSSGELKTSSCSVNFASNGSPQAQYCASSEEIKDISVAAGAKISQGIPEDPYALDTWKEKPDSVMTVYFVSEKQLEQIRSGGIRDLVGSKEGMLSAVPIG
jgi:hypothetical protein